MDQTNVPSFTDKLTAFGGDILNVSREAVAGVVSAWQSMPTSSQVMVALVALGVVALYVWTKFKHRALRRRFLALKSRLDDPVIQATRIATAEEFERV